jgi:hypothetical protein
MYRPRLKREFEKHWFGRWNWSLDPDEDHGPFTCAEQCQERSKAWKVHCFDEFSTPLQVRFFSTYERLCEDWLDYMRKWSQMDISAKTYIERFPKQMIMISGCSRRHSNNRSFVTMWVGNAQETCANSVLESVKDFVQTNKV